MRIVEAGVFLSLAGALHLAALSLPGLTAGGGGGAQGSASVTLEAAPESLAALAARWDAPPDVASAPAQTLPPSEASTARAHLPVPEAPVRPPQRRAAMPAPLPEADLPAVDTAPPAPLSPSPDEDAQPRRHAEPTQQAVAESQLAPAASQRPAERPPLRHVTNRKPPRAEPSAPSSPRQAQRAVGTGAADGAAGASPSSTASQAPSAAQLRSARAQWGGAIRQSIARAQRYPRGSNARGVVTLTIAVSPTGQLAGVTVSQSSGTEALDRAAVEAARSARLPRAPRTLTAQNYSFNLPLRFARR